MGKIDIIFPEEYLLTWENIYNILSAKLYQNNLYRTIPNLCMSEKIHEGETRPAILYILYIKVNIIYIIYKGK